MWTMMSQRLCHDLRDSRWLWSFTDVIDGISFHFLRSIGMNILDTGFDRGLGCPLFCRDGFYRAGTSCHLFVMDRLFFFFLDFWTWQSTRGIRHFQWFYLNFDSTLFETMRDSDFTHWADLYMSSDPTCWNRKFIVSRLCILGILQHLRHIHHPDHGLSRNIVQEKSSS